MIWRFLAWLFLPPMQEGDWWAIRTHGRYIPACLMREPAGIVVGPFEGEEVCAEYCDAANDGMTGGDNEG